MSCLLLPRVRARRRRRPEELLVGLLLLFAVHQASALKEVRCSKVDIRNFPARAFDQNGLKFQGNLSHCTIIEGSLSLSMITNATGHDFPVFQNLREITGYLLVFSVHVLRSLNKVLPNLRVIGGSELIMNYALIVFQCPDIEEIGLTKLTTIRNGGVRIAENPHLCFAKNIDWQNIMQGQINDVLIEDRSSLASEQCEDFCEVENESACRAVHGQTACWNETTCQPDCPYTFSSNGTEPGPGCSEDGHKCHDECIGGCQRPNDPMSCFACRHVISNAKCIAKCPPEKFVYMNRRCITESECRKHFKHKAFEGRCHNLCPEGYQEDPKDNHKCQKCETKCPRKCKGKTVDSMAIAMQLKECSVVEGNLEIELRTGMDAVSPEKLTEAFGKIEVIEGYLLVRFSPSFLSLSMFKSLRVIRGAELFRRKYSLIVFDNQNLRQLFHPDSNVTVENGRFQFQNNRMLCYNKITEFMHSLGKAEEMDVEDQSPDTNGERAICDESTLEVNVTEKLNNGFILVWTPINASDVDFRKFLGYQVFYKEVEEEDYTMSIDDNRSACSDSWLMHFEGEKEESSQARGAIIVSNIIKSNTLYAYYVQTRMVKHNGAQNAVSKIGFVRTKFGQPNAPRFHTSKPLSEREIEISWEPPTTPNGDITHYTVTWTRERDELNYDHVCDHDRRHHTRPVGDDDSKKKTSALAGLLPPKEDEPTCAKVPGCCQCGAPTAVQIEHNEEHDSDDVEDALSTAQFENAIQNTIFVQHKRHRRAISDTPTDKDTTVAKLLKTSRNESREDADEFTTHALNVTGMKFVIKDLKHYGSYRITIAACQNVSEPDNSCSPRPAWKIIRTLSLPENDVVNNETISVKIVNGTTADTLILWDEPEEPNGAVLGYRVKLINTVKHTTPFDECVNMTKYNESGGGFLYKGLPDGVYRIEIRAISLAGLSAPSSLQRLHKVHNPGFFTLERILIGGLMLLVLFVIAAVIIWRCVKVYYGKQVGEFIRQISANPEYLSQMEVYKQDEWELKRDDLIMEEEIGRGTFGKVFRGRGKNVTSVCGAQFGECAIKTVTEAASSGERLHFLIEASVMKQFNTNFIVKLYGVVSDGQPVLVVMEMMGKGNLRDYLRSRRPDAEENLDQLPVPTEQQYFEWAAQIADGMAYLESLKFCHRDLAARNCMVQSDETVKIGDFGMARDIYYHEYYKPTGKRLMPVRWMAPESLKDGKFTMKSDVWSYGIVLYEMLTLAQQPYQGLANDQVFNYIGVSRKILEKPMDCPDFWYDLMVSCWRYVPRDRPSFHQLVNHLIPYASDDFREKSFVASFGESEGGGGLNGDEPPYVPEGHHKRGYHREPGGGVGVAAERNALVNHEDEEQPLQDLNHLAGFDHPADHYPQPQPHPVRPDDYVGLMERAPVEPTVQLDNGAAVCSYNRAEKEVDVPWVERQGFAHVEDEL